MHSSFYANDDDDSTAPRDGRAHLGFVASFARQRLPLAWLAASPTARLIAEQHNAHDVVLFDRNDQDGDDAALLLSTSSTSLRDIHRCVKDQSLRSGTRIGGIYTVLVSSAVKQRPSLGKTTAEPLLDSSPLEQCTSTPLRTWITGTAFEEDLAHLQSALPVEEHFLFASTTVSADVLALPEEAVFHSQPSSTSIVQDPHGVYEDHRNKCKSASATLAACRLRHHVCSEATTSETAVVYRQVFVEHEEALSRVLLGVSEWWLQKAIGQRDMSPATCGNDSIQTNYIVPLHLKFTSDVFYVPWYTSVLSDVFCMALAMQSCLLTWLLCMGLPHSGAVARWKQGWTAGGTCWAAALLSYVSSMQRGSLRSVTTQHWETYIAEGAAVTEWPANQTLFRSYATLVAFALSCLIVLPWALVLLPAFRVLFSRIYSPSTVEPFLRLQAIMSEAMHRLGCRYRRYLQAVDLSHTSVSGDQLLSFSLGLRGSGSRGEAAAETNCQLRALDLSGCSMLHQDADGGTHSGGATEWEAAVREDYAAYSSQREGERLLSRCLPIHSSTGRALSILTSYCGLQLLHASGSSLDDAALVELGRCALWREAQLNFSEGKEEPVWHSSLLAVQLASCDRITSLYPLSYIITLLQVLCPFSGVRTDPGKTSTPTIDVWGATSRVRADLRSILQDMKAFMEKQSTVTSVSSLDKYERTLSADEAMCRRFLSHLYHIDVSYCVGVTDMRGTLGGQQLLQYVNVSQTRITNAGLGLGLEPFSPDSSTHSLCPMAAPVRVLIAQLCDYITNLDAVCAYHATLQRLHVRSGSLHSDGLRCFANGTGKKAIFSSLLLVDLSYCEKIEDVSALGRLPALHTLLLDNSEALPSSGIVGLQHCKSLRTLSLRCCPGFAAVGPLKWRLDKMVVPLPQVTSYIYEDLAGDEKYREKID